MFSKIQVTNIQTGEQNKNELLIYPQPATTFVRCEGPLLFDAAHVEVMDISGRVVKSCTVIPEGDKITFLMNDLVNGMYFFTITDPAHIQLYTGHLVKM